MNYPNEKNIDLSALFALSRDAVLGVERSKVVFANAAAERLFGREVRGARLCELLPELNMSLSQESGVTAVTLNGVQHTVSIVVQGEFRLLTILRETPVSGIVSAALLSRMRSAAFSLRFAMDRLIADQPGPNEKVNTAYHSYYTLQHLIGQLSDAETLARGELALREQTLDLAALVRELVDSTAYFIRDRRMEITCRIEPGDYPFRGDRDRMEQLLLILLGNSLLHTASGGELRISLRQTARQYVLSVDDNGEGMGSDALSYAFTPRGEATPAAAASGAGLGLYIAYELTRAHGGAILLQSEPGHGTRVRVTLPRTDDFPLRDAVLPQAQGPERILTELSGVLPAEAYDPKYRE